MEAAANIGVCQREADMLGCKYFVKFENWWRERKTDGQRASYFKRLSNLHILALEKKSFDASSILWEISFNFFHIPVGIFKVFDVVVRTELKIIAKQTIFILLIFLEISWTKRLKLKKEKKLSPGNSMLKSFW